MFVVQSVSSGDTRVGVRVPVKWLLALLCHPHMRALPFFIVCVCVYTHLCDALFMICLL